MKWKQSLGFLIIGCGLMLPAAAVQADKVKFYISYSYHDSGSYYREHRPRYYYSDHNIYQHYSPVVQLRHRHHANCRHLKRSHYIGKKYHKYNSKHYYRDRFHDRYYRDGWRDTGYWHY